MSLSYVEWWTKAPKAPNTHIFTFILTTMVPQGSITIIYSSHIPGAIWTIQQLTDTLVFKGLHDLGGGGG